MLRGKFIAIEGADGVGSTTQAKLLVKHLSSIGVPAKLTAEPSSSAVGVLARSLLKAGTKTSPQTLALLFAADRIEHYENEIEPALEEGVFVVSDRYTLSSLVYQSLELPTDWIRVLNRYAPAPDATLLITLPFEIAWERICARIESGANPQEMFDKRDIQEKIHGLYSSLLPEVSGISVDGFGSEEQVADLVVRSLLPALSLQ